MTKDLVADADITINASSDKVWDALINPSKIKKYMMGTTVTSDWKEGSSIQWKGEWKGKSYEDKGTVLRLDPGSMLQYTHYSPMTGLPDVPENYHTVTIKLSGKGAKTMLSLSQDGNATEKGKEESEKNWKQMLGGLKDLVEEA